jgi:hypothetical protein
MENGLLTCVSERSASSSQYVHTERVRIARPEKISRRIVQRQQRQSRLPAATKLSRSHVDVVVVLEARTMSLSSSRAELLSRAASRSPARAVASGGEGRGARPRAADEQLVGGGEHAAHGEHADHGRDARGVEAQRLVEGRRGLPSRGGRACDAGGRGASREAGGPGVWWRHTSGMHGEKARLKAWGPRARAERTENM